jgi:hypothetical protein
MNLSIEIAEMPEGATRFFCFRNFTPLPAGAERRGTMKTKLSVVLILLFFVSLAHADYFTGNDLIKLMDSRRDIDIAMYRGYVAGV